MEYLEIPHKHFRKQRLSVGDERKVNDSGYLSTSSGLNIENAQKLAFEITRSVQNTPRLPRCNFSHGGSSIIHVPKSRSSTGFSVSESCSNSQNNQTIGDDMYHSNTHLVSAFEMKEKDTDGVIARTLGSNDDNEDIFYPNSTVLKYAPETYQRNSTSFWLGCEFKYLPVTEKLKVKFHQAGVLQRTHTYNRKVFIKVTLGKGINKTTTKVKLGKEGDLKKGKTEIYLSCADIDHTELRVKLFVKKGIFSSQLLGKWIFPFNTKMFDWQSKWMHILAKDVENN